MTLRSRLVIVIAALMLVALAVVDVTTYSVIKSSLVSQVDTQLQGSLSPMWQELAYKNGVFANPAPFGSVQVGTIAAVYARDGTQVGHGVIAATRPSQEFPDVPTSLILQVGSSSTAVITDLRGPKGVTFRVLATPATNGDQVEVVGYPLTGVGHTLGHVLALELLASAGILLALGIAAWLLIRLELRSLQAMAATAGEIAAGDLSRRVEDDDSRTEVGQLGASLNVMLSRIERAFQSKEASEERLRRFVADASHELRTPLTSIRGYAELLRNGVATRA
ncbi:MAG: HAMP domain-containing protein, partial [Acidimicrobiales bacterium]